MFQISHPLPAEVGCAPGHRPQLIEARGAPAKHTPGQPCPTQWHIECVRCGVATVPHTSRAIAELRWSDPDSPHRIPLSLIGQARERMAIALPTAA